MGKFMLPAGLLLLISTGTYAQELADASVLPTTAPVVNPNTTSTTTVTSTTVTAAPSARQVINCSYKLPADTSQVDPDLIIKWSEKAAQQSFDFESSTIDNQLLALKDCYTDQGWLSFNEALQKSGNLNAITSQKLNVSSMVNGQTTAKEVKANQWKVSIPLQVVYQNDKEKVTQLLRIDLLIGRKITGDLGIMQMIASPLNSNTPKKSNKVTTTPSQ